MRLRRGVDEAPGTGGENRPAAWLAHLLGRAISRPVVQHVDLDALCYEVLKRLADDVGFVEGRHERDNAKPRRRHTDTRRSVVLQNRGQLACASIDPAREGDRETAPGKKPLQL